MPTVDSHEKSHSKLSGIPEAPKTTNHATGIEKFAALCEVGTTWAQVMEESGTQSG
jgi:hypothetical protein